MSDPALDTIHATTVAIGGRAVAIRGVSGAGKSDLALRLIDRGAALVADDRTRLRREGDRLVASVPETIAGLLEVRGIGIVTVPGPVTAPLALIVDIGEEERMPEGRTVMIGGVAVVATTIDARAASAAIKVELALARTDGSVA